MENGKSTTAYTIFRYVQNSMPEVIFAAGPLIVVIKTSPIAIWWKWKQRNRKLRRSPPAKHKMKQRSSSFVASTPWNYSRLSDCRNNITTNILRYIWNLALEVTHASSSLIVSLSKINITIYSNRKPQFAQMSVWKISIKVALLASVPPLHDVPK